MILNGADNVKMTKMEIMSKKVKRIIGWRAA